VLSVQIFAFLLAYLAVVGVGILLPVILAVRALGFGRVPFVRFLATENTIDIVLSAGLVTYMYLAFRRAYRTSRVRSAINAVLLTGVVGFLIAAYHAVLFYAAFWTT
jgi:hypothetical protein